MAEYARAILCPGKGRLDMRFDRVLMDMCEDECDLSAKRAAFEAALVAVEAYAAALRDASLAARLAWAATAALALPHDIGVIKQHKPRI